MNNYAVVVTDQSNGKFLALHFVEAQQRTDVPNIILSTYGYDKSLTIITTYDA